MTPGQQRGVGWLVVGPGAHWLATLFAPFMGAALGDFDHEQIDGAWVRARDEVRAAP